MTLPQYGFISQIISAKIGCGGGGIRTPGTLITHGCFQDSCNKPLCHPSGQIIRCCFKKL